MDRYENWHIIEFTICSDYEIFNLSQYYRNFTYQQNPKCNQCWRRQSLAADDEFMATRDAPVTETSWELMHETVDNCSIPMPKSVDDTNKKLLHFLSYKHPQPPIHMSMLPYICKDPTSSNRVWHLWLSSSSVLSNRIEIPKGSSFNTK